MLIKLFKDDLPAPSLERIINIMYNLQLNLGSRALSPDDPKSLCDPLILPLEFLKLLRKIYKSLEGEPTKDLDNRRYQTQRKIMSIAVVASANDSNHMHLLQSKFYN